MRIRRPVTSVFLVLCGITLLVSIYAGEKMGARVLQRTTKTAAVVPEAATPIPVPSTAVQGPIVDWHRLQVVSVPTDPGFPDPRVTKPPTPSPKPSPRPTAAPPSAGPFGAPVSPSPGAPGAPGATPTPSPASTLPSYAIPTQMPIPGVAPPGAGG